MKPLAASLLIATALIAADASAETTKKPRKKLSQTRPGATWLMNDYMDCKKVKKAALEKDRADLTCDEKANLHFCSIMEPLPKDVQNNIALELYCNFLAGEHPDTLAQDEQITKAAEKAGCFEGGDMRAALNEKYKDNTDATDALENFTTAYFDAEDNCYKPDSAPKAPAPAADAKPTPEDLKPSAGKKKTVDKSVEDNAPAALPDADEEPSESVEH